MGRELRQEIFEKLLKKSEKQGYITFEDIMKNADEESLSLQDLDWLSAAITLRGIIVYNEIPSNRISTSQEEDEYDDYAQSDYEAVYERIIELDASLKMFVNEIRNIKPPQWRELPQLKYQMIEGNQYARERMVEMHLRNAVKIALQRAENFDMDIQDAISEACVGLVIAVNKYNPDLNGPFGSYASMWILQNLKRNQPTKRPLMYYPVYKKELFFSAYPILKECEYSEDTELRTNKVAYEMLQEKLSLTNEQTCDILDAATPFMSIEKWCDIFSEDCYRLQQAIEEDIAMPRELYSEIDVEDVVAKDLLKKLITEVLGILTEKERKVLVMRYGLDDDIERTLEEIGHEFNVSRERIRQIESKAINKLRHPAILCKLRDYFE